MANQKSITFGMNRDGTTAWVAEPLEVYNTPLESPNVYMDVPIAIVERIKIEANRRVVEIEQEMRDKDNVNHRIQAELINKIKELEAEVESGKKSYYDTGHGMN